MSRRSVLTAAVVAALAMVPSARAAVLINEFVYDDGGTDDREFVELYNSGASSVNIGNWVLRSSDTVAPPGDNNGDVTIPANTMLAPGAYYVIGYATVPNVNQVISGATGFFENDNETTELLDDTGAVQDQITYERYQGATAVGPTRQPLWGAYAPADAATTGLTRYTVGRWVDGRDTLKNGQDFGIRLPTPGANNNPSGTITAYTAPSVSAATTGSTIPGYAFGFVEPRVIEPTVVDANNRNAIPNPPNGETKVHTAWDPSGGGNGVVLNTPMTNGASFHILAYLDTNDIPINLAGSTPFRGSEITMFGLGSADPSNPLTDLTGAIQLGAGNLSLNGATGISWIYEKAGITGSSGASEKLHLVDTNASGNSNSTHVSGLAWTILATFDLSNMSSDWYELAISIDALGNGQAMFDGNVVNFTTIAGFAGGFYAGYRENLNLPTGSSGVPTYVRPPTWTLVPEPASLSLLALGLPLAMRRCRS